ncbi:Pentatricopeptide repeat-containing protein [Desulfovibrio sp. X2]|uniref:tetratricopeptide repeat protein n=1 Tax=Desulfovibrio sp. X2 TaxID=941449 RepID=UPI000358B824|nr:tetratricopeptide repeat protein [Desulfovibrio sp. X2]EPR39817.1 Pentatricopeptide repeat-containing protein [Desulfovibrio sp. X2]
MAEDLQSLKKGVKTIREHVARAKAYVGRMDVPRTLEALCDALSLLVATPVIMGREKFEITILIDEVLRTLAAMPQMQGLLPKGIALGKGQEKQLLARLSSLRDKIRLAIEKAEYEKVYAYKQAIDKAILCAQQLAKEGQMDQARLAFRKTADRFAGEPGILQDIGGRLVRCGMFQEAVEYLEEAIKGDPKDPRPYNHLLTALENLGETERALEMTKTALRNFGPSERTYTIMARLHCALKQWDEAFDMANAALDLSPYASEAEAILDEVRPRIFGRDADGKIKDKKTYTFNL